jgi:Lrp/AsnC family leucine-responsive transcriptional regulator
MDHFDALILEALQENGKVSTAELGRQIGLSTTATKERIRKLEIEGVIKEYTAILNAKVVGNSLTAFITIPVGDIGIQEMGEKLAALPEVLECHKVTGNVCYFVKAKVRDAEHLEELVDFINHFARNTYTYLVLSTVKETTRLKIQFE